MKNIVWDKSNLVGSRIQKSEFGSVKFVDSNLAGIKCTQCFFEDSTFSATRLDGALFFGSTFKNVEFIQTNLSRVDFVSSRFENCVFDAATAKTVPAEFIKKSGILIRENK